MKFRTCPNCGYKYTILQYYKTTFNKEGGSKWDCPNCNKELMVSFKRQLLTHLILLAILLTLYYYIIRFINGYSGFIYLILLLILIISLPIFDVLINPKTKANSENS